MRLPLTNDQKDAIAKIKNWLSTAKVTNPNSNTSNDTFFLFQGYAGTGKTFTITRLVEELGIDPHKIAFTAPTNKAVKVIKEYLSETDLNGCRVATIYSLLGLTLEPNGEVKEIRARKEPVDLSRFQLIIVDEASMINSFLFKALKDAATLFKVPFILMGDPAQLPPVKELTSPIWKIQSSAKLTEVMRFGDSMLDLSTAIRKVVDNPFPRITIQDNPPVHRVSRKQWLEAIANNLDLIKTNEAKVIAWRNLTVDHYNRDIRRQIFGPEIASSCLWAEGDRIIATSPIKDLEDKVIMFTDDEAEILSIAKDVKHPILHDYKTYYLRVKTILGNTIGLYTLMPESLLGFRSELTSLSLRAKKGEGRLWKDFWELKETFAEIRHAYAITSHRAQGSSYKKVFVDLEDIMCNRNRNEAFRSLYVACTRQREELWIS